MTRVEAAHLSGLSFDWIIVRELRFLDNLSEDAIGVPLKDMAADIRVETRVDEEKRSCRVLVRVTLTPSEQQKDRLEVVAAALEGQFTAASGTPAVGIAEFARRQAPAIIMPFVREAVATASARTRFGQILLPPINVIALMEAREKEASAGVGLLRQEDAAVQD